MSFDQYTIYKVLLSAEFISAVLTFVLLYFLSAPYGRYTRKGWGIMIPEKLGWFFMELPAVLIMLYFYLASQKPAFFIFFLLIWQLHYVQRTFIYPFLIKGKKKMPLVIVLMSLSFNLMNGYVNGYFMFKVAQYDTSWFADPRFVIGLIVFIAGFIINIHSDHVLRTLRKPGETGYKIPDRGLHKLVASPNYFGEILEWGGWTLLTWSPAGLAFFVFTIANLVPRAHAHRKWYRQKFEHYPDHRKRVIPFIY